LFATEYILVAVLGIPEEDSIEHPVAHCYLYNTVTNKVSTVSPIIVTGLSQWCEDKSVILRLLASFNLEVPSTDNGKFCTIFKTYMVNMNTLITTT